jgi:hydrogenase/urease accessory protein HupE
MNLASRCLVALALLGVPQTTVAHPVFGGAGGFGGGLLHPLFVPAHLMAVVAIAALIAQQQSKWHWPSHWPAPFLFIIGLAAGFVAIAGAYAPTYSSEAVLACATIAGFLVAFGMPLLSRTVAILAAATGVSVALDSPPDVISIREAIRIQLGTFCGAIILLVAAIEFVSRHRHHWQRIGTRIIGSWIAASAILVLALCLVR